MRIISYWFPVIIWMGTIFFLSSRISIQVVHEEAVNFIFFKMLHVIEYSILFVLLVRALRFTYTFANLFQMYMTALMLTVLYAVTDEIHQVYVPSREGRIRDVIIDALGAGGAWIYLQLLSQKIPKKLRVWGKNLGIN